ncbi:magnesium-transporting ATPase (P-type) [Parabacteroides sp. PFB2-10]|nr:magnesium-transporting ATPase (P-type) [Parabacteroides sp. PFB2-10]
MQNEDDLRGLAKVMEFMRAISILFVIIHIYWFCYEYIRELNFNLSVVDKILLGFNRTAGLFSNMLWTKLFAVVFMGLSCLGTKGVKEEKITWTKISIFGIVGVILFFLNWWILDLFLPLAANTAVYIFTLSLGYICMLMAGLWMSRLLKNRMMDDVFNYECARTGI